ncbi:MAG: S1 RNA-binding domain-containing protein, partial [Victivallales bacterium]|nr:S1 RNA-binding domain-containing protein [Victivallales bacterium]
MTEEKSSNAAGVSFVDLSNMDSMDALLGNEAQNEFAEGSIIEGKIVEKRNDGVLVDIGYKAEGFVHSSEFRNWEEARVGDVINVYLEEIENENSMPELSVAKAHSIKAWEKVTGENAEGSIVKGVMKHRVKGGIIVDVDGVEAFLPGSQIDIGPVRNMDEYIGKEYDVKVLKINE